MKYFLLHLLVCPTDKQPLELKIFNQRKVTVSDEIKDQAIQKGISPSDLEMELIDGLLLNKRLNIFYPLFRGVPRLLLFQHPLIAEFKKHFGTQLEEFYAQGFKFPDDNSIPGEKNVLASFSNEWTDYDYNEEAYWGQTSEVYNNSLFSTLNNASQNLTNKLVLEVGIGSGGSANDMSKKFKSTLIGVDLGYGVDVAYKNFGTNPFLHIVQASAFNLPFKDETFDFVYSHGVIHHTYNTRRAFNQLSRLPKKGGRLYIWVYSFLNESRTTKRKIIMKLEQLIRPWCSMLPSWLQTVVLQPIAPLYIFHQNTVYKNRNGMAKYSWREAIHAARDRFTPKYIHRHSEQEVMEWFKQNNYQQITPLSERKLPDYVTEGFYMNTGVEGFKL